MSSGALSTVPPSSPTCLAAPSQSATAKYVSQFGGTSFSRGGRAIMPPTWVVPALKIVYELSSLVSTSSALQSNVDRQNRPAASMLGVISSFQQIAPGSLT